MNETMIEVHECTNDWLLKATNFMTLKCYVLKMLAWINQWLISLIFKMVSIKEPMSETFYIKMGAIN